jgi:hypothetical protein
VDALEGVDKRIRGQTVSWSLGTLRDAAGVGQGLGDKLCHSGGVGENFEVPDAYDLPAGRRKLGVGSPVTFLRPSDLRAPVLGSVITDVVWDARAKTPVCEHGHLPAGERDVRAARDAGMEPVAGAPEQT